MAMTPMVKHNGWKYVGEQTGTNALSYPSSASEIYIKTTWNNDFSYFHEFYMPIISLNAGISYCETGAYRSSNDNGAVIIKIDANNRTVALNKNIYGGQDVTSTSKTALYYRE